MVKIRCPICNGTGRVESSFGGGGCPEIIPQPISPWYGNITTTTTTTSWRYFTSKVCPGCNGTGVQECCCKKCNTREVCKPHMPEHNPYVPFTPSVTSSSAHSNEDYTYTITFLNFDPTATSTDQKGRRSTSKTDL